jgi:hypothetical protein
MVEDILEQVRVLKEWVGTCLEGEPNVDEFALLQDVEERLGDCADRLLAYIAPLKLEEQEHERDR